MVITIRFRPGRDKELEEWYKSIPSGDRSRIVRDILKENIEKGR